MQLCLSSASADTLPVPARTAADPSAARSDSAAQKTTAQSEERSPSDFNDHLSSAVKKPKSAPSGPTRKQNSTGPRLDSAPALPLDPSASPDLAALLAFLASPVAATPSPATLPEIAETLSSAPLGPDVVRPAAFSSDRKPGVPGAAVDVALPSTTPALPPAAVPSAPPRTAASPSSTLPLAVPAEVAALPPGAVAPRPTESTTTDIRRVAPTSSGLAASLAANLAGSAPLSSGAEKAAQKSISKNFLTSDEEGFKNITERLGTDVAKPAVTMAAVPFPHRQSSAAETGIVSANVARPPEAAPDFSNRINDTTSIAHRAVDAVMSAAERVTGERSAVDLQFSFGGSELAVRVEYRGGAVHATFRTDSPELRAALAHEWSAAGSKMTDASVRMAPPVFTSSHAGSSTSFSGEGAQQHARDSAARASAEMFSLSPGRAAHGGSTVEDRAPVAAPRAAVSTAVHLHTFA